MSAQQARVYKEMLTKLKLGFQQGTVTAANEGVLFGKLMQIASGTVYTTDKKVVYLDNKPRMDTLVDKIQEAEGKVIVFASFIPTTELLHQHLNAQKIPAALINGNVSAKARAQVFYEFQNSVEPRVLVAHPRTMAHGLTLTEANVIIWFTPPPEGLDTYQQACARITRPGQRRTTYIIHLTAAPIEAKIYRRLQQSASLQGALLEMFEAQDEV
jgi:SNF2 family DNA or RNA helicase